MRVAILGCGTMGSAFARQLSKKGHQLLLLDRNRERCAHLAEELGAECADDPKAATKADLLLLAIKPKDLPALAKAIGPLDAQILLSILAGTSLEQLKAHFPGSQIVRGMPNLALTAGETVFALVEDPHLTVETREMTQHLLDGMGLIFWTGEEKIEAITALAGSGPAFVIAFIEAMTESGVLMGLKAEEALSLTLQTVIGAVALIEEHGEEHPAKIRWKISAPGGTTIEGMRAFEKAAVRSGVMDTLLATYEKAKNLHERRNK